MKLVKTRCAKLFSMIAIFCLLFQQMGFAQMAGQFELSHFLNKPAAMPLVDVVRLPHLRYLAYDNAADSFRLLLEKGYTNNGIKPDIKSEGKDAFKYFLIGINLPNDTFWVNLRPDSQEQIIDNHLAKTDVGLIMLEADLQLKKDTAGFTSPATPQGKAYWDKLYKKAEEIYGPGAVSIPTLTRPWIVPGEVIVHYSKDSAYIYKATLKVMLEQDYLKDSAQYNFNDSRAKELNEYSSQLIRELIIPQLTKEVNTSQRYAKLRQVYYSLILAQWFKGQFNKGKGVYAGRIDRSDLTGLVSGQSWSPKTYFAAYQKSFKDGEYKLQMPAYSLSGKTIRTYFSGGANLNLSQAGQAIELRPGQGLLTNNVIKAASDKGIVIPFAVDKLGNLSQGPEVEESEGIDLNRLEHFINAKSSPINVISQEVKDFVGQLFDLGYPISLDGFKGLGDLKQIPGGNFNISDLIKGDITRSVTTNNSIMFNIIDNMSKTELSPEEFQSQFLGGRDIGLAAKDLKLTPLVGAILETLNQDSRLLENEEKLFIDVYNKINEQKIAARIGAYVEPVWLNTGHRHGYISVEPFTKIVLEGTVEEIVQEAKEKFRRVQDEIEKITGTRPRNIFLKLPVTDNGLAAAEILLGEGYSINYTLIATVEQYRAVIRTFKAGIKKFVENKWQEIVVKGDKKKTKIERVREFQEQVKEFIAQSVASIFVSRDDRNIYPIINDPTFAKMIEHLELRLKHETNTDRKKEIGRKILLYKAMAPGATEEDIKLLNANKPATLPVSIPDYNRAGLAELKNRILEQFESLKVKDEKGEDLKPVTKVGVAFTKAEIYPIFQEEFEQDQDWLNFIETYQLPKELMSQQIYLASTGVKVKIGDKEVYTTNPYYLQNLVGPNITNTIPYPVIYEMVRQGKALFEPKILITENLDEARETLEILEGLGIDVVLIKKEIIFKDGLDTFDKDDNKSLGIIGGSLPVALEVKKILDSAKSSPLTVERALAALESSQSPLAKKMLPKIKDGRLNKDKLLEELGRLTYVDLPNDVKGLVKLFIERPASYGLALEEIANGSIEEFSLNSQALAWVAFIVGTLDVSSPNEKNSSPLKTGGIDFRYINLATQAQMKEVINNFKLPSLDTLKNVDISSEASKIMRMINGGIAPSSQRIIKYIAACYVKDGSPTRIEEAAACLADLFRFQEDNLIETDAGLKAFLIVMDAKK